ncbi:hypothetical protein [Guptibacillus algicola]|uniref:hypothetical protein n=1 Tax=Guptibacillus algicola TaxID=225844 RepID=UPI001CD76B22|nr:hypothetical protein [Alkalihalobacillus algicola]MCA0986006.1 hypothetical protein [Alkalihalobacillus algicola]
MRKDNGYTLMDAMIGLSILMTLSMSMLPIFTSLYEKRISIANRTESVAILEEVWSDYILLGVTPPSEIEKGIDVYRVHLNVEQMCVMVKEHETSTRVCRSLPYDL